MTVRLACVIVAGVTALSACGGVQGEGRLAQTWTQCVVGTNVGPGDRAPTQEELTELCEHGPPTTIDSVLPGPGAQVIAQAGCEACHKIGANGNDGPGPDLTEIGARMPASAIRKALVHPVAPMPSFRHLGPRKLEQIVDTLAALRGDEP